MKGADIENVVAFRLNNWHIMGMIRTHTFLPEPMLTKLRKVSKELDISVAELIRRAIAEFLDK